MHHSVCDVKVLTERETQVVLPPLEREELETLADVLVSSIGAATLLSIIQVLWNYIKQ